MMQEKPLFIFEMANNHQGSVAHGKRIIAAVKDATAPFADRFLFAVKFQYRDLDTFIHRAARGRADIKNVKRFEETILSRQEFQELLACVRDSGFLAICTPFDEVSAARVKEDGYDYSKIASCSFADWPLMEAIAAAGLPVIASTAGSDLETVHNVVSFFRHRKISLVLMHCIGEYPTPDERLQMNQIDLYRREFPELTIGFSTHEVPDNLEPVKIAVAKGARVFEKHVGLSTVNIALNRYSASPEQTRAWLAAADATFRMCGVENGRYSPSEEEAADLAALRRGAFSGKDRPAAKGALSLDEVYLAFPSRPGQLVAQDFSKYTRIEPRRDLAKNAPLMRDVVVLDTGRRALTVRYVVAIVGLLKEGNVVVPAGSLCELSHHYGFERFEKTGLALITCVNREYCKKLLVVLPGQNHPTHYHIKKEETFLVLHGELAVVCGAEKRTLTRGESMTMPRNEPHSFSSEKGCVFEEISSTHYPDDSYYEQDKEFVLPRKTDVYLTRDILRLTRK
jgi:sialic acid synthase SpsE/mannose-6-phosphate isomerase-like protein (cupin superfamily)